MSKKTDKKKQKGGSTDAAIPVVAILGHVDHGKTSLLDYIRETNTQLKEVGGITQSISAFTIEPKEGSFITFIDTPGHEAFDLMRLRGGSVADIALLIVAADDGVKPQTVESIEIIKNSTVKPVVVITKKDLNIDNVNKIKRDLANRGLLVEGMGGNIPVVETSTKSGEGIDELLEMINLVVDVEGLKDVEELPQGVCGKGYILESVKDKSMGYVVSMVVTEGAFEVGDWFVYKVGDEVFTEKIKSFITEDGSTIKSLPKGCGGKIIGLSNLVDLGVEGYCLKKKDEQFAKTLFKAKEASPTTTEEEVSTDSESLLEDFFKDVDQEEDDVKVFKVILKASSEGALEAIKQSISKISIEGVRIEIVNSGVGNISLRDVDSALVTKAIILGFEVAFEKGVEDVAKKNRVFVKNYDIIYKLIDEIKDATNALVEPEEVEDEIGNAEIKAIFELSDGSKVIGCKGREGVIKRGEKAYVVRDDDIITEGKITSMKHNKADIKEAGKNDEFGVILNAETDDLVPGDILYCFKILK